jgi:hypothetical protein
MTFQSASNRRWLLQTAFNPLPGIAAKAYYSSQVPSKRQPLKMLLTITVTPCAHG